MKRLVVVATLAFLMFVGMRVEENTALAVAISIAPSTASEYHLLRRASPETYTCRAEITGTADPHYTYATPTVVVAPGEQQTTTAKGDGLDVSFTVAVSRANDRAKTEVVVKRAGAVLLRQKSDVILRTPGRAIVPLQPER
jgi:hypothetical protein